MSKIPKNPYKGRYEARDYIGHMFEKEYKGSKYDAETGLLCYEECEYLLKLLDPNNEIIAHYITMNVFL